MGANGFSEILCVNAVQRRYVLHKYGTVDDEKLKKLKN
jgi:hypothetical protein